MSDMQELSPRTRCALYVIAGAIAVPTGMALIGVPFAVAKHFGIDPLWALMFELACCGAGLGALHCRFEKRTA